MMCSGWMLNKVANLSIFFSHSFYTASNLKIKLKTKQVEDPLCMSYAFHEDDFKIF